jgi:hypothetical protein
VGSPNSPSARRTAAAGQSCGRVLRVPEGMTVHLEHHPTAEIAQVAAELRRARMAAAFGRVPPLGRPRRRLSRACRRGNGEVGARPGSVLQVAVDLSKGAVREHRHAQRSACFRAAGHLLEQRQDHLRVHVAVRVVGGLLLSVAPLWGTAVSALLSRDRNTWHTQEQPSQNCRATMQDPPRNHKGRKVGESQSVLILIPPKHTRSPLRV